MNVSEIRKRLEELNNKGKKTTDGGNKKLIWKAQGDHQIRCLPQKNSDDPFLQKLFHYDINAKTVVCPKNEGNDCAICDFADKLRAWNDADGKPKQKDVREKDFELFKKIQAKPRYFVAMVERGKESEGARYWSLTSKNYEDLLKICMNEDWNADRDDGGGSNVLVNPANAHDLTVTFKNPGEKGNKTTFKITEIEERKKPSKLTDDKALAKKILDSVPSLDEAYPAMTSSEVRKIFLDFVNGGAGANGEGTEGKEDKEYGGSRQTKESVKSHNGEKLTGTKGIDEAFEDILNS